MLVDTQVIVKADPRWLASGIGGGLATWFEAEAAYKGRRVALSGGVATQAALTLARLCYDTLMEYGVDAMRDCAANVVTPAVERVIEANTLLSGLGFESAGLASAHSIHNGLTRLPGTHDYYHGEKVAIGVLAGLFLADRSGELIDEVYDFCESIGLPTNTDTRVAYALLAAVSFSLSACSFAASGSAATIRRLGACLASSSTNRPLPTPHTRARPCFRSARLNMV